jgi:hypothetical protein
LAPKRAIREIAKQAKRPQLFRKIAKRVSRNHLVKNHISCHYHYLTPAILPPLPATTRFSRHFLAPTDFPAAIRHGPIFLPHSDTDDFSEHYQAPADFPIPMGHKSLRFSHT